MNRFEQCPELSEPEASGGPRALSPTALAPLPPATTEPAGEQARAPGELPADITARIRRALLIGVLELSEPYPGYDPYDTHQTQRRHVLRQP